MSSEAVDEFILLILSSPSGAGKTTLSNRLRGEFPGLRFSVSHTTRKPRPTEVDGREYHFVDRSQFEQMIRAGSFAEHAQVHGNLYGTTVKEIDLARTRNEGVLFDIDYQGARQIKASFADAKNYTGDVLNFETAAEMADMEGIAVKAIIVNDDVDGAYGKLRSVVLAERCKRQRWAKRCEDLLAEAKRP